MTKATTEGRRLVLTVDGIDEPFYVDPIPAKRGRALTELFVALSMAQELPAIQSEAIFIEAINARNYARMVGSYVDEFDSLGRYEKTWGPGGVFAAHPEFAESRADARFIAREARSDLSIPEPALDGEAIRQEEAESLSLCAFYWQSVVGIEAVNAFIEGGEGTAGSLKALNLLLIRLGRSSSMTSSPAVTAALTQQEGSSQTTDTETSPNSVRLPANKRGYMQNPAKRKQRRR